MTFTDFLLPKIPRILNLYPAAIAPLDAGHASIAILEQTITLLRPLATLIYVDGDIASVPGWDGSALQITVYHDPIPTTMDSLSLGWIMRSWCTSLDYAAYDAGIHFLFPQPLPRDAGWLTE